MYYVLRVKALSCTQFYYYAHYACYVIIILYLVGLFLFRFRLKIFYVKKLVTMYYVILVVLRLIQWFHQNMVSKRWKRTFKSKQLISCFIVSLYLYTLPNYDPICMDNSWKWSVHMTRSVHLEYFYQKVFSTK